MSLGLQYKNQEHIFDEKTVDGVPFLSYPMLEETGIVHHGFSTKLGGVSKGCWATMNISTTRGDDPEDVEENQRRIARAIGVKPEDMTFTNQTHTTNVAVVRAEDKGRRFMETDGMITNVPGICLVTFYADCVPLYFVDPVKKAIGLSHSGWRGTVGKIGKVTVELMQKTYGSDPKDILAAIGPSICQDCYEVSEDVIVKFQKSFEEKYWPELFYQKENGKYQLNLWKANELVFEEAGILKKHIAVTNVCTHCNPDILFSHRTTGNKKRKSKCISGTEIRGANDMTDTTTITDTTQEVTEATQQAVKQVNQITQYLQDSIPGLITFGLEVLAALVAFFIGRLVIKWIRKIVRRSFERSEADKGVEQFVDSLLKYGLYGILIFCLISSLGFDTTSVAALLASSGVAIGLALQGSLSNFAGGVLILLLKPFVVGDYIIEDTNGKEGTVKEIQIFYTKLSTIDNKTIVIPNGMLTNNSITNATAKDERQLDLRVGISYNADIKKGKINDRKAVVGRCKYSKKKNR